MDSYSVYKHTFPNGKVYIGITKRGVKSRWRNGLGYKKNKLMYKAINKYGWQNILHETLFENLTKAEAENKEIELISFLKSNDPRFGYNINNGGNCCGTHSKETREKISKALKGKQNCLGREISKEHLEKMKQGFLKSIENGTYMLKRGGHSQKTKDLISSKLKGKKKSEETKRKLVEAGKKRMSDPKNNPMYGKHHTEKTKKAISEAKKGKKLSEEQKRMISFTSTVKRKVYRVSISGEATLYNSLVEASNDNGISSQNIGFACRNKTVKRKGFYWRYYEDFLTREEAGAKIIQYLQWWHDHR